MAIIVAAMVMVLFTLSAMVVELGLARDVKRQSQIAADAAALAAGNVLYGESTTPNFTAAVAAAKDYASNNFGVTGTDWAGCTDPNALRHQPDSTAKCISFQSSASPTADQSRPDTVRVLVPNRNVTTGLGTIAGISTISLSASAEAGLLLRQAPPCALCILDSAGAHNIQNGDIQVTGEGGIHFNGNVTQSSGGFLLTDKANTVEGTFAQNGGTVTPAPLVGQPRLPDPLAFVPTPNYSTLAARTDPCAPPPTGGPGIYGSFTASGSGCTLSPGLYVIAGGASVWSGSGNSTVTGNGVTLFFTCGTPQQPAPCAPTGALGASLDASGSQTWALTAPTQSTQGSVPGMLIFYDRNNTSSLKLKGGSAGTIEGTLYAARAILTMFGNGCLTAMKSQIVVWQLHLNGNPACLHSRYAVSQNVELPPNNLHLSK